LAVLARRSSSCALTQKHACRALARGESNAFITQRTHIDASEEVFGVTGKRLARALITIAAKPVPPKRFIAGADAVEGARRAAAVLVRQTEENLDLSSNLGSSK
jgi:hypothetical protein